MLIRWMALAVVIMTTIAQRLGDSQARVLMWSAIFIILHLLLGSVALFFWNAWLSGAVVKTRRQSQLLFLGYIGLPVATIAVLIVLQK